MAEAGEGTEKPTPKRREKAREEGQVVLSPELSPVAVLTTVLALGGWWTASMIGHGRSMLRGWLARVGPMAAHGDVDWTAIGRALGEMGGVLLPFALTTAAVGISTVVAQVGWNPRPQALLPKLEKISLATGWQRIVSVNGAINLLKAVLKIAAVGTIAYWVVRGDIMAAVAAPAMQIDEILALAGLDLSRLLRAMVAALAVIGALDYLWQHFRHERSLLMTSSEVKEEQRQAEGNPHMRGRFRKAHRELAKRRMLADVARADVIITNPVHVAVALRYRADEGGAPRVLAKGAGELCERIKAEARRAGIPIIERRALARAIFRAVEIGAEIPPALYRAVAEILAYVYSLRGLAREAR